MYMNVIHVWHSGSMYNIAAKDLDFFLVLLLEKHPNGASWRDTCSVRSQVPVLGAFSLLALHVTCAVLITR